MPDHKCGNNAYTGQTDIHVLDGGGWFGGMIATAQAYAAAMAEAKAVYDRDCPAGCTRKFGFVSYALRSFRRVTITRFFDPTLPAGKKFKGYRIVIDWQLLVTCLESDQASDPAPDVMGWDELEDLIEELLRNVYGDKWRRHIKRVSSAKKKPEEEDEEAEED